MITGCSVSHAAVAFQVAIYVFLFVHFSSENKGTETDLLLPKNGFPRSLCNMLSPDMFSQADPFQYLLLKTSKLRTLDVTELSYYNESFLKSHRYPQRFIPYAEVLASLLQCWPNIGEVSYSITCIQNINSSNNGKDFPLPADIIPSLESFHPAVFSSDIFSDPNPPSRILNLLLDTPKEDIQSLKIQLQNLFQQMLNHDSMYVSPFSEYYWYTQNLKLFMKNESVLYNLKQDIAQFNSKVLNSVQDNIEKGEVDVESDSPENLNDVDH